MPQKATKAANSIQFEQASVPSQPSAPFEAGGADLVFRFLYPALAPSPFPRHLAGSNLAECAENPSTIHVPNFQLF